MGADNTLLNLISCGLLEHLALKWMKGLKPTQQHDVSNNIY